jgi:hypothetical protein
MAIATACRPSSSSCSIAHTSASEIILGWSPASSRRATWTTRPYASARSSASFRSRSRGPSSRGWSLGTGCLVSLIAGSAIPIQQSVQSANIAAPPVRSAVWISTAKILVPSVWHSHTGTSTNIPSAGVGGQCLARCSARLAVLLGESAGLALSSCPPKLDDRDRAGLWNKPWTLPNTRGESGAEASWRAERGGF